MKRLIKILCIQDVFFVVISLFVVSSSSCSNQKLKIESVPNKEYTRDSIFIDYTLRKWLYKKHSGYYHISDYFDSTKPTSKYEILIDTILYSPDKRKLFSFIIYKYDTSSMSSHTLTSEYLLNNLKSNFMYDGRTIVGYRDSVTNIWTLRDFQPYIPLMFFTKEALKKELYDFYCNKIKDKYLSSNLKGSVKYEYGIIDPSFWGKSVIWKKGFIVADKYIFELYSNDKIMPTDEFDINYPDSILALFK